MVLCALCQVWQHAICFGFLEEKSVPHVHICILCSKEHVRHCTDPSLTSLAQAKLKVCVWPLTSPHLHLHFLCPPECVSVATHRACLL